MTTEWSIDELSKNTAATVVRSAATSCGGEFEKNVSRFGPITSSVAYG